VPFADPPRSAAFKHRDAREGFEVVFFRTGERIVVEGRLCAVEAGGPYASEYVIELDRGWRTHSARVREPFPDGIGDVVIEADGHGRWRVNGEAAPELDGCIDLDLEASSLTNAFPVRRHELSVGERVSTPAAWVRSLGLRVERLEQRYERLADSEGTQHERYHYSAPGLNFSSELEYDRSGLVVAYPGIAVRVV
jgi:uncharacterized protein